jgi:hypothetical protein
MTTPQLANDSPDYKHPQYAVMRALWQVCRDFVAGTATVRAKRETYLPRHEAEEPADYDLRLKYAVVYNAFARALDALTGLAFQNNPELGADVGPQTRADWENIDLKGTHGDVFARRLLLEGLITGYVGLLTDMPPARPNLTLAQERALGVRPYWVMYTAEQIVNWRVGPMDDGQLGLTLLVLDEPVVVPDGAFGQKTIPQFRVFRKDAPGAPVLWQVWRQEAGKAYTIFEEGVLTNPRIPFGVGKFGPTTNGAWLDTRPPLYDLAELNISHYRLLTDRRHIMHLACVPILAEIGSTPPKPGQQQRVIGPGALVQIPNPDGDLKYVEPAGTGLAPTREELQDTERRMAQTSLAFLASETRAAETAEGKRIDSAAQNATLSSTIRALEDLLEEALGHHAYYRNETPGSVTLNRQFEELELTPQMIKVLSDMVAVNQLDLDTFWELLKQGRILPEGFKADVVKARLLDGGALTVPSEKELDEKLPKDDETPPEEEEETA